MPGICERGFMLMFKKFGILGALAVGVIGTPSFQKNWSLKIRNNWSAPIQAVAVLLQIAQGRTFAVCLH